MYNNGVYIGTDIEVVVTDDFTVSYRRNSKEDFLESSLCKKDNSSNKFVCIQTIFRFEKAQYNRIFIYY